MEYIGKVFDMMDRVSRMGENLPKEDMKKGVGAIGVIAIIGVLAGVAVKGIDAIKEIVG